jgi:hypothetical protein
MFDTHKLNETGFEKIAEFKTTMSVAVNSVLTLLPEGREKSIFITKLEEAMFFGTKAIASGTENHTEITKY